MAKTAATALLVVLAAAAALWGVATAYNVGFGVRDITPTEEMVRRLLRGRDPGPHPA